MTIKVGERLPNVTLTLVTADGPKPVETKDYFAGKTVVLFGLPGAFTPTCHKNHLPGFIANEATFKAKGVDAIAMTSVNDHHVLGAWSEATGAKGHIDFLADGSANFAKAVGLDLDLSAGRPGPALEALFDAGRRRRGEGAQHRARTRQGGRVGRGAYSGADRVGRGPETLSRTARNTKSGSRRERAELGGEEARPFGRQRRQCVVSASLTYRMLPVCPSE